MHYSSTYAQQKSLFGRNWCFQSAPGHVRGQTRDNRSLALALASSSALTLTIVTSRDASITPYVSHAIEQCVPTARGWIEKYQEGKKQKTEALSSASPVFRAVFIRSLSGVYMSGVSPVACPVFFSGVLSSTPLLLIA